MASASFTIEGRGVFKVRLEPTEIVGAGNSALPLLTLRLHVELHPIQQQQSISHYTILRLAGRLFLPNEFSELARFEKEPLLEKSSSGSHDRTLSMEVPLDVRQIKRIEELRDGNSLALKVSLTGLAVLDSSSDFRLLDEVSLQVSVPKSHWIEEVLNKWTVSDLRLLEINFAANGQKELAVANARLAQAELHYRAGAYPQVLTELRSAFAAIAGRYSMEQADRNMFERMLVNTHPKVREKLRHTFDYCCRFFDLGPHEPNPTPEVPTPISRHDARFALITAHAIFEYFASENWPGI